MVPEYWQIGEAIQDRVIGAGYEHPTVEGIAVDIHDLLQAADLLRESLAPTAAEPSSDLPAALEALRFEIEHLRWHCDSAKAYLDAAIAALPRSS